jgi:hypothetical protein
MGARRRVVLVQGPQEEEEEEGVGACVVDSEVQEESECGVGLGAAGRRPHYC